MSKGVTNARITFTLNSSEFQEQMKAAKRSLQEIEAEFSLAKAEAKAFGASSDTTRAQISALTEKIEVQRQKIALTSEEYRRLTETLAGLERQHPLLKEKVEKATEAYEKSRKELGKNAEETQKLKAELDKAKRAYEDNAKDIQKCTEKQSNMKVATDKAKASLAEAEAQLRQLNEEMARAPFDKFASGCEKVSDVVGRIGRGLSVASGAAIAFGGTSAKAAIDYETAFAGVKKTVDATEEELEVISDGIRSMAREIPATTTEIAGVAEAAGQLGIATEDILDFSRVMIDLGVSTNLSSDEAASSLAKFANVTKMEAANYSNLGSVIVSLGNNFATTEADIVSMATRLASTGDIVGLSQAQIMAVATALSSVGIEAEAGGSAVSKLLKNIETSVSTYDKSKAVIDSTGKSLRELQLMQSHDSQGFKSIAEGLGLTTSELSGFMGSAASLEQFASVSGKSADEFIAAWGKDAVSALDMFITGLSDTERNGANAIEILQSMGLTEVRLSNAVLALSNSGGILTEAVGNANAAWAANNALTKEAEQRYGTTESQLQITKNNIANLQIELGEKLLPVLEKVLGYINDLVDRFSGLNDEQQNTIIKVGAVVAAAGPAMIVLSKVIGGVGSLAKAVGFVAGKIAGAGGLAPALSALAGPAGIAVAAIAAVAAGLGIAYAKNEEVRSGVNAAVADLRDSLRPAAEFLSGTVLPGLSDAWQRLLEILQPLGDFIGNVFASIWQDMLTPAIQWLADTLIPSLTDTAKNLWNNVLVPLGGFISSVLDPVIRVISELLTMLWENVIIPLADCVGGVLAEAWDGLAEIFNTTVIPVFNKIISVLRELWEEKLQPIAKWLWNNFKPVVAGLFDYFKTIFATLKGMLSGVIEFITGVFTGNWEKALGGVKKIATSWWEGLKKIFTGLWDFVKGIGDKLKNVFNFEWNLPKIKVPHFSFEWNTEGLMAEAAKLLGLKGVPSLSVEWYKNGGIMTQPTAFGFASGRVLAGGEAGDEAILPLAEFYTRLSALLDEKFKAWSEAHESYTIVYVTLDGEVIAERTAGRVEDSIIKNWRRNK